MAYAPSCMHPCLRALSILILASIVVAGSVEEPPSYYRAELTHVDANGGFTRDELIPRAAHRALLRAATLSATDATALSIKHLAAASYSDYEYLVDLEIGTWPEAKPFRAVLDTGSDMVLLTNLNLCNPDSSSFTHVPCSSKSDEAESTHCTGSCTCCNELSMFQKKYGDGTMTAKGFMGSETLTLISATTRYSIPGVVVGCAIDIHGDRTKSAAGILGLDRGPGSLLAQFKPKIRKFSYCLNDPLKPDLKSQLLLGNVDLTNTGGEKQIAKLVDHEGSNKYYVHLDAISIGDHECQEGSKKAPNCNLNVDMLVDSGTSYISLPGTAFDEVEKSVAQLFNFEPGSKKIMPSKEIPFYCYPRNSLKGSKPEMILRFAGEGSEAIMRLPWSHYMVEIEDKPLFCLFVLQSTEKYILGNFQMQNMTMLYDLDKKTLSFVKTDCTQHSAALKHAHIHVA